MEVADLCSLWQEAVHTSAAHCAAGHFDLLPSLESCTKTPATSSPSPSLSLIRTTRESVRLDLRNLQAAMSGREYLTSASLQEGASPSTCLFPAAETRSAGFTRKPSLSSRCTGVD